MSCKAMTVPTPTSKKTLKEIGEAISIARRRRVMPAESLAARIGCSTKTLSRLENGDPGISLITFVLALQMTGLLPKLRDALDPLKDADGILALQAGLPQRIRRPKG